MKQYQNRSALKNNAKNLLAGKWGYSVLLILIELAIVVGVSYILTFAVEIGAFTSSTAISNNYDQSLIILSVILYIISFFIGVLGRFFNIGCYLFFLNIASGQSHSAGDLFFAFRNNFGKNLTVAVATTLPQIVLLLPYQIAAYVFRTTWDPAWLLLTLVSLIVGLGIYVPVALSLAMAPLLLLDFPQYSAKEILQQSFRVTKGHKGRLFLLELSFLPLYILCVFSFGIGYLWVLPYMFLTYVLFYLDLMNPQVCERS